MTIAIVEAPYREDITVFAALDDLDSPAETPRLVAYVLYGEHTRVWYNFYVHPDYRHQGLAATITGHIRAQRPGAHYHQNKMDPDSRVAAWRLGVYPHPDRERYPEGNPTVEEAERMGQTMLAEIAPMLGATTGVQ